MYVSCSILSLLRIKRDAAYNFFAVKYSISEHMQMVERDTFVGSKFLVSARVGFDICS